eukprot:TRINITY_DN3206_c1_g1_i1.p1 TRINITY_DN3206_c1_g1~~TRINITY_DN3206_c1_g1_i1.p1  ORF type:complete len:2330 (+),score=775.33 TRINITY_DN3206_c1_g1_i1:81-6992(+)
MAAAIPTLPPGRPRMVMDFGSALGCQIKHLLQTLTKTNYAQQVLEIEKLTGKIGEEAYRLLLLLLFQDVSAVAGASNGQSNAQSPEQLKIKLLSQELQKLPKYPNFITIASGIVSAKLMEGRTPFLQDLVKCVSMPLPVQLALGLAFSHSCEPKVQEDGQKFLKNKLGEITPNAVKTLPECLVHHLLYYIQTTEVFTEQAKILMQLESLRQSLLSLHPLNVGQKELQQLKKKHDEDQVKLPSSCLEELSLAGIMDELGPGCTTTVPNFTAVVDQFPRITAKAVGKAIGMMAMYQFKEDNTYEHCQQAFYDSMVALNPGSNYRTAPNGAAQTWNVANFVEVIKSRTTEGPSFWHNALRALDFPGLNLTKLTGLTTILQVMKNSGEEEIPLEYLLGDWTNKEAQLSILSLCLKAPPHFVKGNTERVVVVEGTDVLWASVDLVETLLNLAVPSLQQRVLTLFESNKQDVSKRDRSGALAKYPELLLLVLLNTRPHRTEVRRDLVKKLLTENLKKVSNDETKLLVRAAKENIEVLCQGLVDTFLESALLAESILNVAVEGKWIEPLMHKCPSAKLLSQIILLSGKRGGPDNRLGGPQWVRQVLEGKIKVSPDLPTLSQTLLTCIELSPPDIPVNDIADVLCESNAPGLSPQQKQLAKQIATDRRRPREGDPTSFPPEVEEEANNNFAKIYHGKLEVMALIQQLERYKVSQNEREQNVYQCMVHNLFDEFRFFNRYPIKELRITAELFGGIVAHGVLGNNRLAHALKFVLQNLAKPPHENLKNFSIWALDMFKHRLPEWPQYCTLLERVRNIEQMVPGISDFLRPQQQHEQVQPPAAVQQSPPMTEPRSLGTPHTDISTLEGQSMTQRPDRNVQEKIAMFIHQIDPNNPWNVSDIQGFLQKEHYPYFAEYLVVKRASLEPNYHKLYMSMLEKMANKELDAAVVQATYTSIKTLLASDKIRTNSSERSLLKNLGSWLGLQTIGRNKPLMARDLDLKGLLFEAITFGRLIAVVPFVAKVLEHSATSKVFKPPNPWLMGILSLLVDLYQLPDLKLTLKFEVEVLCKNINLPINELQDTKGTRSAQRERLESIRKELQNSGELDSSTDFNPGKRSIPPVPIESQKQYMQGGPDERWINGIAQPEDAKVWQDNMKQPLPVQQPGAGILPINNQLMGPRNDWQELCRVENIIEKVNIPIAVQQTHPNLKQYVGLAIDKALKESVLSVAERSAMIACTTTEKLVIKDYATEPDDSKLRKAAQQMVKCLAAHLAMVTCKEMHKLAMRNNLKAIIQQAEVQTNQPMYVDANLVETLVKDNLDVGVNIVEKIATEEAAKQMELTLAKHLEERQKYHESGAWKDDVPFDLLPSDQKQNNAFIRKLPEPLRPKTGLLYTQKSVYDDFARMTTARNVGDEFSPEQKRTLDKLDVILKEIEKEAMEHYQNASQDPRNILSLTHPAFTTASQSPQHEKIKKLLCNIPHLIKEETATLFARHIFNKVFTLSDRITQEQRNHQNAPAGAHQSNPQGLYVSMLINEVCLFILQSARDRNAEKIVEELTKLFIQHDKKWNNKDIAVNFIRLRLIDVAEFDKHLTKALQVAEGEQPMRHVVEFAGSIVQKCLVDEKLTSQKDLRSTLDALEKIAKVARLVQGQPQGQGLQPGQPQGQPQVQPQVPAQQPPQHLPPAQAPQPTQAPQAQQPQEVASPVRAAATMPVAEKDTEVQGLKQPIVKIPSLVGSRTGAGAETREKVFQLLCDWINICTRKQQAPTEQSAEQPPPQTQAMQFVSKLQQAGLLKADYMLDKFFALLMEISVEDYCSEVKRLTTKEDTKNKRPAPNGGTHPQIFQSVDAFSDLIVLLIKCCAWGSNGSRKEGEGDEKDRKEEGSRSLVAEVALVNKVLSVVSKVLINNHEYHFNRNENHQVQCGEGQVPQDEFKQQPYFRFFSSLLLSLNPPHESESSGHNTEILVLFANILHTLSPTKLPGFAFAWLELLSHRIFMPKLLLKNQEGWPHFQRLLVDLLKFLEPWLRQAELSDSIRLLYKGTLKVLLVLLHDFPEFLCNYHFSFCDVIPQTCIQMRNVILSSFPRQMKLPDPFTPNLKVDRLPEISQPPTILSKYLDAMVDGKAGVAKDDVDAFLRMPHVPRSQDWLAALPMNLRMQGTDEAGKYNAHLIHSLVLHVGIESLSNQHEAESLGSSPAMAIYKQLAQSLDAEGRYVFIGSLANQLRFPNNHTHYFSCVVLHLFLENLAEQDTIQEQITRVLLERLIVNRPHPWGLLITFIELVKNPAYDFWSKKFIRCSPDIERLFESVGQSCAGLSKS